MKRKDTRESNNMNFSYITLQVSLQTRESSICDSVDVYHFSLFLSLSPLSIPQSQFLLLTTGQLINQLSQGFSNVPYPFCIRKCHKSPPPKLWRPQEAFAGFLETIRSYFYEQGSKQEVTFQLLLRPAEAQCGLQLPREGSNLDASEGGRPSPRPTRHHVTTTK